MSEKETMTLNLTKAEMEVLEKFAEEFQMSKTAVMRSALRLYQLVQHRLASGERMAFTGDEKRLVEFVGPDFPTPQPNPIKQEKEISQRAGTSDKNRT